MIYPTLPLVSTRSDIVIQINRHMEIMENIHHHAPSLQDMAKETITRCQHFIFEERGSHQKNFLGKGIVPMRMGSYIIKDMDEYAKNKKTLNTTLGLNSIRKICPTNLVEKDDRLYDILDEYVRHLKLNRRPDAVISTISKDQNEIYQNKILENIVMESKKLSPEYLKKLLKSVHELYIENQG